MLLHRATLLLLWLCSLCGPLSAQSYTDVTATSGLALAPGIPDLGRGGCVGDFDGDGDLDLIHYAGPGQAMGYFRNDGGMSFTDLRPTQPLPLASNLSRGMCPCDVDRDGDQDVFVAQYGGPLLLLINDGAGNFTEEGAARGLTVSCPGWQPLVADYDLDGWVDVFLGTYIDPVTGMPVPNRLWRGTGGGSFVEVTGATGIEDANGFFLAGTWFDEDEDGYPDLILANDRGADPNYSVGTIYRNNGNGTFTNTAATLGMTLPGDAMSADAVDLFNDGGWEVFASNVPPRHFLMSKDRNTGTYVDLTFQAAVQGGPGLMGWGSHFMDADNDGWQDLHVVHLLAPNALYMNPGQASPFTDVAVAAGCADADSQYTSIVADFDDDGGLDILNYKVFAGPRLLRQSASIGHWIKIETEGTVSNRDGFGALIELTVGTVTQRQHVRAARGYLTASDPRVHFGLGAATTVDEIRIRWPSGATQVLTGIAADQILKVTEPTAELASAAVAGQSTAVGLRFDHEAGHPWLCGLSLGATPGLPLADGRTIPLNLDSVLLFVLAPNPVLWPTAGVVPAGGAPISIPLNLPPGVSGLPLVLSALTLQPAAPGDVLSITAPHPFVIL